MEKAGSNPALDTRTGMRPREGLHAARRSFASARSDAVLLSLTPTSPVPQRAPTIADASRRQGGGEDVCYFGRSAVPQSRSGVAGSNPAGRNAVAEYALRSGNSIARSPPTLSTIRGEDRCYIVFGTRGRGFESRPAFHAPVAQLVERYLACRVSCRLGSQHRLFPDRGLQNAGGEEFCYFALTRSKVRFLPDDKSVAQRQSV